MPATSFHTQEETKSYLSVAIPDFAYFNTTLVDYFNTTQVDDFQVYSSPLIPEHIQQPEEPFTSESLSSTYILLTTKNLYWSIES